MIGAVMSPVYFPIHLKGMRDGMATKQDIGEALSDFGLEHKSVVIDGDVGAYVLCELEVCFELKDGTGTYQFPAHVQARDQSEIWTLEEMMVAYCGRRVQCCHEIDMISPGSFTTLQCRLATALSHKPVLWQGGMKVLEIVCVDDKESSLEGLIELQDRRAFQAVDVVTRGPLGCEVKCKGFLDRLLDIVMAVLRERSPGTALDVCYLSRRHITQLAKEPHGYTESEIVAARARKHGRSALVSVTSKDGSFTESLEELMALGDDASTTEIEAGDETFAGGLIEDFGMRGGGLGEMMRPRVDMFGPRYARGTYCMHTSCVLKCDSC